MAVLGLAFGVVVLPTGPPQDMVESTLTCIDSSTGEVLWKGWQKVFDDPLNAEGDIMEKLLSAFPARGEPMY